MCVVNFFWVPMSVPMSDVSFSRADVCDSYSFLMTQLVLFCNLQSRELELIVHPIL